MEESKILLFIFIYCAVSECYLGLGKKTGIDGMTYNYTIFVHFNSKEFNKLSEPIKLQRKSKSSVRINRGLPEAALTGSHVTGSDHNRK
jgi:hypothetical protein